MAYESVPDYKIKEIFLAEARQLQMEGFKNDPAAEHLRLTRAHWGGGVSVENFWKEGVLLKDGERLEFITNQNVLRDTTLLWHCSGKTVREALRHGLLKPQALTAKAIKAFGLYRLHSASRSIKSRIESYLYHDKLALVEAAQNEIEALQGLERFVGRRVPSGAIQGFCNKVVGELLLYLENYPAAILASKALERELRSYQTRESLEIKGARALSLFIKERLITLTRKVQAKNQELVQASGSRAYLRGFFNSVAEDVISVVRQHHDDLHNPVTAEHQLSYPANAALILDSDIQSDGVMQDLRDWLLVASVLKGDNDALLKIEGPIQKTASIRWRHVRSFYEKTNPYEPTLLSSWAHFKKQIQLVLLAPFLFFETALLGEKASWFGWGFSSAAEKKELAEKLKGKTDYYALNAHIQKQNSLSVKLGLEVHKAFRHFLIDGLVLGLLDGFHELATLKETLPTDFQKQEAPLSEILKTLDSELFDITRQDERVQATLPRKQAKDKVSTPFASPLYPLVSYHSQGLLNGAVSGVTEFSHLFSHNLFAKHPFTAVLSSLGSAASFLAFFNTPLAVQWMGKPYVYYLKKQGYLWTNDLVPAAFAGSFTQFKLVAAAIEGVEHGPDSWLGRGLSHLWKDPAKMVAYTGLSWGLGYSLVYLIKIPGLSAELAAHVGNPAAPSLVFGGLKFALVGYQLLSTPALESALASGACSLLSSKQQEESEAERLLRLLSEHREKLYRLSPLLKLKIKNQLQQLTSSTDDARALEKLLYPEQGRAKSTLRSFLGRIFSYLPVLLRCGLSLFMGLVTRTWTSFLRPWRDLSVMLWDDLTSTTVACSRLFNVVLESVFNRIPRTLADIVVNGVFARLSSFFGYHAVAQKAYQVPAAWDCEQERLAAHTTGRVLNYLIRENTAPHPVVAFENIAQEKSQSFYGRSRVLTNENTLKATHREALSSDCSVRLRRQ